MLADETDISETARFYGLSLRALRFYEQVGLLNPVRYRSTRIYTAKDRVRIELILTGKRLRLSLAQIREMIEARCGGQTMSEENAPGSLVERLTRDEIQQQLQTLERQRDEVEEALEALRVAAEVKGIAGP